MEHYVTEIAKIPPQVFESLNLKKEAEAKSVQEYLAKVSERASIVKTNKDVKLEIEKIQNSDRQARGFFSTLILGTSDEAARRIIALRSRIQDPGPEHATRPFASLSAEERNVDYLNHQKATLENNILLAEMREQKQAKKLERKIEREKKQAEKLKRESEQKETTEALAAAHTGKTRDQAEKIKRQLLQQRKIYPNCPYCFGVLDSPTSRRPYISCFARWSVYVR